MDENRRKIAPCGFIFLVLALAGCCIAPPGPDENTIVFSVIPELPAGSVDEPYEYSFCEPDDARSGAVCGGLTPATNPIGGKPPYSIVYGEGLHPTGINLQPNGLFIGAPAVEGTYDFEVCARDGFGTSDCEQVMMVVNKKKFVARIEVKPSNVIVKAPLCMESPCKASTKVIVSSNVPWYVDYATGSATKRCFDTVTEFSRYWSMCPSSGGAGETEVELSTMVYGEATPDYLETLLQDRGSLWRIESVDDPNTYSELRIVLELPYPN